MLEAAGRDRDVEITNQARAGQEGMEDRQIRRVPHAPNSAGVAGLGVVVVGVSYYGRAVGEERKLERHACGRERERKREREREREKERE